MSFKLEELKTTWKEEYMKQQKSEVLDNVYEKETRRRQYLRRFEQRT